MAKRKHWQTVLVQKEADKMRKQLVKDAIQNTPHEQRIINRADNMYRLKGINVKHKRDMIANEKRSYHNRYPDMPSIVKGIAGANRVKDGLKPSRWAEFRKWVILTPFHQHKDWIKRVYYRVQNQNFQDAEVIDAYEAWESWEDFKEGPSQ